MGACVVRWYTVYEEYDGGAVSHSSDVASVPMGFGRDADLRRPGVVGVQALHRQEAEYSLNTSAAGRVGGARSVACLWGWRRPFLWRLRWFSGLKGGEGASEARSE